MRERAAHWKTATKSPLDAGLNRRFTDVVAEEPVMNDQNFTTTLSVDQTKCASACSRFARPLLSLSWGGRETRLSTPRLAGHSFSGPGAQGVKVDDPNLTARHFNEPRLFKRLECALHDLAY
jgi:hypothetical protein